MTRPSPGSSPAVAVGARTLPHARCRPSHRTRCVSGTLRRVGGRLLPRRTTGPRDRDRLVPTTGRRYRCRSGLRSARRLCHLLIAGCPGWGCRLVHCQSSGPPPFAFSSGYLGAQGAKPLLPQNPIPAQPFIDLGQRLRAKTVDSPLRVLANLDKPRLPQHPEMARYPWPTNRQQPCQLPPRLRTPLHGLQHRPPPPIPQPSPRTPHTITTPVL